MAVLWPQVQPAEQPEPQQPGQRLHTYFLAVPGLRAPGKAGLAARDPPNKPITLLYPALGDGKYSSIKVNLKIRVLVLIKMMVTH